MRVFPADWIAMRWLNRYVYRDKLFNTYKLLNIMFLFFSRETFVKRYKSHHGRVLHLRGIQSRSGLPTK